MGTGQDQYGYGDGVFSGSFGGKDISEADYSFNPETGAKTYSSGSSSMSILPQGNYDRSAYNKWLSDKEGTKVSDSDQGAVPNPEGVDHTAKAQEGITALAGPESGKDYDALAKKRTDDTGPEGGFANYEATTKKNADGTDMLDDEGNPILDQPEVDAGESFSNAESTVAGQLESILSKGSPLQQLAQSRAREQSSALGMMSSSAGIGASQRALYDSALPIAQQDAKQMGALKMAEQATKNKQTEINTEANVAGDLLVQKAKVAEQQKKIDDSFAIKLKGLDKDSEASALRFKAGLDSIINGQQNDLARDLGQMEIDANVEATIMNQARDMINQVQISQQQLLGNDNFLNNFKLQAERDQAFNDLLAPVGASIVMSGRMAGVYDADFEGWVNELIAGASWG